MAVSAAVTTRYVLYAQMWIPPKFTILSITFLHNIKLKIFSEYIAKHILDFLNQNKCLNRFVASHNYAISVSFVSALSIGTNGNPFTDGEFLKTNS